MRISGGDARGARLKVPRRARAASERVRQAVFNHLGDAVVGSRVLDLFCGSGAYGLEALSRGAEHAVFVDRNRDAVETARANARSAGLDAGARFVRRDVRAFLAGGGGRTQDAAFDLAFVDPPYGERTEGVLRELGPLVEAGGRIVLEMRSGDATPREPAGYIVEADKRYGDTRVLTLLREGTR